MINENQTSKWKQNKKNWKIHFLQVLSWVMRVIIIMYVYLFSSVLTGIFNRRVKTMYVFHFDALWFPFVRTIGPARTTDSQLSTASVRKSSFFSHSSSYRLFSVFVLSWNSIRDSYKINRKIESKKRKKNEKELYSKLKWISRQFKCLDFMNDDDDDDRCVKCLL